MAEQAAQAQKSKISQVNSAIGIMGPTGSGKSALLATLAKYVWRKFGKVTRYYNSDGGGYPALIQECMALGIMEVFRMRTRDPGDLGLAFETAQRAAQGWWPRRIMPSTGEVPPGVEMVPPIAVRFHQHCKQGHLVRSVPSESLLIPGVCPTCKIPVTKLDMQITKTVEPNKGFEHVGAVCFDGLSSTLAWEMLELGHRAGRMELKGEEAAIGGKVVSGDLKFGGTTRSHVGFVQSRGEELVHLALGIPNLLVPPVYTMLTHEDVDDRGQSIRGPKIAGRAKTDEAPAWFGNMLEAGLREGDGGKLIRTLYLSQFYDQFGIKHLCKHRGSPGTMPSLLEDPPDTDGANSAQAFTGFNLGVFLELLDAALIASVEAGKTEFPDAPGVPDGWIEIGDSTIVVPRGTAGSSTAPVVEPGPVVVGGPQVMQPKGKGIKKTPVSSPQSLPTPPVVEEQVLETPPVGVSEVPEMVAALESVAKFVNEAVTTAPALVQQLAQKPAPAVQAPPTAAPKPPATPRPVAVAAPAGRRPGAPPPAVPVPRATVTGPGAAPVAPPTTTPAAPPAAAVVASPNGPKPPGQAPRPPTPTPRPIGAGVKET